MVDDVSGSSWSHIDGLAVAGPKAGEQLTILPLQTTTWGAWLEAHPSTTVIDIETGFQNQYREDVELGRDALRGAFLTTLGELDERLAAGELVIGVLAGSEALAFPLAAQAGAPMQGEVDGVPVVILEDGAGVPSLAYHRALSDGRVLQFERLDGAVYDVETGTRWSPSGLGLAGELAGVQLTFVTSFFTEWYGWAAFHPETGIFGAGL